MKDVFTMNKCILLAVCSLLITTTCLAEENTSPFKLENGEKLKIYNKNGSPKGYYRKQGSKLKEYSYNGSYKGYYREQGNKIKHYNKNGSYEGYYKK